MVAEEFLSKIANWVPDYDEISRISSQRYDVPELFSEGVLLSEAVLTKIFCNDPNIGKHFARLMSIEPDNVYDLIFRSWVLKYFDKGWEKKYKQWVDHKIQKYVSKNGLPGKFSGLDLMYAMYASFGFGNLDVDFKGSNEVSFISYYLIYMLNNGSIDEKLVRDLIKFQFKNGSFPASSLTTRKSTVYGTALALIPLIVYDFKSKSVKKAIDYLLSIEPPYGFTKDSEPQLYVNMFASYAIRLYDYFDQMYKDPLVKLALKGANKRDINLALYSEFDTFIKTSFVTEFERNAIMNALGTKAEVKERRADIYEILEEGGRMDPASIIDELKRGYPERYSHLKKRSHITLIKLDLEFMRHLGLLAESNSKYLII